MVKRKNKNNKYIYAGIIAIIILAAVIFGTLQTSFLLPMQEETVTFDGIEVISQSATFETVQASNQYNFCGGNFDEIIMISNSISGGDSLNMETSTNSVGGRTCLGNVQIAKMIIPKGKLFGKCKVETSVKKDGQGRSSCEIIDKISKSITISAGGYPCTPNGCFIDKEKDINMEFEKDTEIIVKLETGGEFSESKSSITLDFIPFAESEVPVEIVKECLDNIDCVEICIDAIPTCTNNKCECKEKIPKYIDEDEITDTINEDKDSLLGITIFQIVLVSLIILVLVIISILLIKRRQ